MDLAAFLQAAKARSLMRRALRLARGAPSHARAELEAEVRRQFEEGRVVRDKAHAKWLFSEAEAQLKQLRDLVNMRG